MAPRKRSAASADTTVVCRVRRRSIDTVLRCAAKPNTAPSTRRHHVLSNDLQGLVWDMDADTPLGRALQNECATRPYVAERTAAREFAAAKTTLNLPMASAKTKARLYTRGMPGPGSSLSSSTCPTLSLRWRQACAHKRSLPGEMGAGTTSFHFKRLYRPRSRSGRSRQELKENKSRGP